MSNLLGTVRGRTIKGVLTVAISLAAISMVAEDTHAQYQVYGQSRRPDANASNSPAPQQNQTARQQPARSQNETTGQRQQPPRQSGRTQNAGQPSRQTNRQSNNVRQVGFDSYVPSHLRTASSGQPPIIGGYSGGNVYSSQIAGDVYVDGPVEEYYDDGYGEIIEGECGCGSCGTGGGCMTGMCDNPSGVCGCGDFRNCPICRECWLKGFGGLICNTEFFLGAHSFDSVVLNRGGVGRVPGGQFGFGGGVNIGLPLQRLTCGLVSGQIGASAYQSEYGGDGFNTTATRNQTFVTAGLFRRVDYGLQFGVVYDYLSEDWFYKADMGQMRGAITYVYGNGAQFGFRFAKGVQDGKTTAMGFSPEVLDNYRFYLRKPSFQGLGFADIYYGFTGESHSIIGAETDIGITPRIAVQSGFTYIWEDQNVDDGYNMYMQLVFRPGAKNWYRNYHRPMFPVANNGSLLTILK